MAGSRRDKGKLYRVGAEYCRTGPIRICYPSPTVRIPPGGVCAIILNPMPTDHVLSHLDGATLSLLWGLPFAGLLLSIAFAPLFAPKLWHDHYGKIAALWAL